MGKTRKFTEDEDIDEARKPNFNRHRIARKEKQEENVPPVDDFNVVESEYLD